MATVKETPQRTGFLSGRFPLAEASIVALGIMAAVLAFSYSRNVENERAQTLFLRACQHRLTSLRHTIDSHLHSLRALKGLYASEVQVPPNQFRDFARQLIPLQMGLQALEWIPRVGLSERAHLEKEGRGLYGPGFTITERDSQGNLVPAAERPEYYPVFLLEPMEGNQRALGFDLASNPKRLAALRQARDSGRLITTSPVTLVQETGQQLSFMAVLPSYHQDAPLDNVEARRRGLEGFCLAVFRYRDMVDLALETSLPEGINMLIVDETDPADRHIVYSHLAHEAQADELRPAGQAPETPAPLVYTETVDLGDRALKVTLTATAHFIAGQHTWQPWLAAFGGMATACLLTMAFHRIRRDMARLSEAGRQLATELTLREKAEAEAMSLARFTSEDPDPILRVDSEGNLLFANLAAAGLLEAWQTTAGKPLPQRWRMMTMRSIATGQQAEVEQSMGERTYSLLLVPQPNAGYANIYGRDITGRKRAEQALSDSETRFRTFFALLPNPVLVYDLADRVLLANRAFTDTFGWSQREVMDEKIDFVPPGAAAETMAKVELVTKGDSVQAFETKRLTKDGRQLDILINTAPFYEEGRLTGNIVVFRDITKMKSAERALRDSEGRYRTLVDAMTEGLIMCDEDNRLTFFNQRFCDMLGYEHQALQGQSLFGLLDSRNGQVLAKRRDRQLQGLEDSYELAWLRQDGGQVFTLVSTRGMIDNQGRFKGSLSLITNITERKILESQLLQAQKLESIGQLAAGIAHEINTPTQYVTDNTRFLQDALRDLLKLLDRYAPLLQQAKEHNLFQEQVTDIEALSGQIDLDYLVQEVPASIEQTLEGLGRIANIVRSMKEFAHPGPDTKTPLNLNKAIANTITVARNEWKYVAEMETDFDPELPLVPCVPGEINQVVLNVIVNAAHAIGDMVKQTNEKGSIRVSTRRVDDLVEIRVADSGPGIPEAIRNRVFDPFFTTKEPGKGTGQGLAIAHTVIADKHKGSISFETEEGRGTTFIIRLPLAPEPTEQS